jgi:hypothetical protein
MRWVGAASAAAAAIAVGVSGCGSDITQARVEDAVGPTFAHLYARQQTLLGQGLTLDPQASATCKRNDKSVSNSGAGDDWVCQLLLQVEGRPSSLYTYELNINADGCYEADGPPGLVGGRTLTTPSGQNRVNPLFAFDGCFDTY